MRKLIFGAAVAALAATPSAARKLEMYMMPSADQIARMNSGLAAVDDTKPNSSVRLVQAEGPIKKRASVALLVMNQGAVPFNFGPENVTATLDDGTPIKIITYEQLVKEERRRETWAAIAAGLGAMANSMNAANAGYYRGTASYSGSTYGSFGTTPFSANTYGTATISGYNAGQAQIAQSIANQQNQATFARMAEENAANMNALKAYMRTTTVDPQQMFGGSVLFELPKSAFKSRTNVSATFVVTVNGEQHIFKTTLHPI